MDQDQVSDRVDQVPVSGGRKVVDQQPQVDQYQVEVDQQQVQVDVREQKCALALQV